MKDENTLKNILRFIGAINISPLLFMVLFSWLLLLDLLERNGHLINRQDMLLLFIYGSAILSAQYFIVTKNMHRFRNINIAYGLIIFLLIVNLLAIYLLNSPDYSQLSVLRQIITLTIIGGIFFLIIKYSERWVLIISIMTIAMLFLGTALKGNTKILDKIIFPKEYPLPENYIAQDFIKKPNIYLLSFDAMMPENIAKNLLELNENEPPAYIDVLKKNNATFIPNAFTHLPVTMGSFSSLLALDLDWYRQIYGNSIYYGREMIAGGQWTPAYDIFRQNGYHSQFVYRNDFFLNNNKAKERGVTYWFTEKGSGFCGHLDNVYALWGYCFVKKHINAINAKKNKENIYHERLKIASQSQQPILTISYTYTPGHTKNNHNAYNQEEIAEYKMQFLKASHTAANILQEYIDIIRANDKDGIILIFADHGAHR